jgi:hypothetical protein
MWLYNNQELKETPEEFQGFVYCITELNTGMMYIGKKFFWKPKVLPVNKTRKRRVRTRVESDWRDYYGSNKFLRQLIEANGKDNYKREILRMCVSKGECSYYEAKLQFQYDVLLSSKYYNEFIGCKINASHLKNTSAEDHTLV